MKIVDIAMENGNLIAKYKKRAEELFMEMNHDPAAFAGKLVFPEGFSDPCLFYEEVIPENLTMDRPIEFGINTLAIGKNEYVRILLRTYEDNLTKFRMEIPIGTTVGKFYHKKDQKFKEKFLSSIKDTLLKMDSDGILDRGGVLSIWSLSKKVADREYLQVFCDWFKEHLLMDRTVGRPAVFNFEEYQITLSDLPYLKASERVELSNGDRATIEIKCGGMGSITYFLSDYGKSRKTQRLSEHRRQIVEETLEQISWFPLFTEEGKPPVYCGMLDNGAAAENCDHILCYLNKYFGLVRVQHEPIVGIHKVETMTCFIVSEPKEEL